MDSTNFRERYQIIEIIKKGTYGILYKAKDKTTDKTVVVKEILPRVDEGRLEEVGQIFLEEIQYLKRLDHFALVKFLDGFQEGGRYYYVTEWLEGTNLDAILEKRKEPFKGTDMIPLYYGLVEFLNYLHSQNPPYHIRMLRPSDILILPDGQFKIVDLGSSMDFYPGVVPEGYFITKEEPDAIRDIFVISQLIFELITKQPPVLYEEKKFPSVKDINPNIHKALSNILDKGLDRRRTKGRERRYQSVRELKKELIQWFPEYIKGEPKKDEEDLQTREVAAKVGAYSIWGCLIIFIALIILAFTYLPKYLEEKSRQDYDECGSNIKLIAQKLEEYRKKEKKYPQELSHLIPTYLPMLPKCPSAGTFEVYEKSYETDEKGSYFIIRCQGKHHEGAKVKEGYPMYSSGSGFDGGKIEKEEDE